MGSRRARHKLHRSGSSLLEFEAVLIRTKNEPRLAFGVRPGGVQVDLEAVSLIEGCEPQLHWRADFYTDRRRRIFILLRGHFYNSYALIRLGAIRWSGRSCAECKHTQQK